MEPFWYRLTQVYLKKWPLKRREGGAPQETSYESVASICPENWAPEMRGPQGGFGERVGSLSVPARALGAL